MTAGLEAALELLVKSRRGFLAERPEEPSPAVAPSPRFRPDDDAPAAAAANFLGVALRELLALPFVNLKKNTLKLVSRKNVNRPGISGQSRPGLVLKHSSLKVLYRKKYLRLGFWARLGLLPLGCRAVSKRA